jgi:DNA polymerase III subunit epsilon
LRQIVLDTETTGLEVGMGHRVIEIGAVEILNRRLTGRHFHRYLNPQREIEAGALQVHGISLDFLQDKPLFRDVAVEFLDFIRGAELIIHNAAFDIAFLDTELSLAQLAVISAHCALVTDTLLMARDLHPGKRNSLDALCDRYQVDHSARTRHGALLDAELLGEVYLCMTRGQEMLLMDIGLSTTVSGEEQPIEGTFELIVIIASDEEVAEHARQLDDIDASSRGACLWKRLELASAVAAAA